MLANALVLDALDRVHELVPAVLQDLDVADVVWQPDPGSNSIGWLIWHLTRVEDDHMAGLVGGEQLWPDPWYGRFGLPYPVAAHGYGMTPADVAAFTVPDVDLLADYAAAVAVQARRIVTGFTEADYDTIIDRRWDPPVTVGVRLVSVITEIAQHIGQAAYVRGLRERSLHRPSTWKGHV